MKILVADDDQLTLRKLEFLLKNGGYDVITATDGTLAFDILKREDAPPLAILDIIMPGLNGTEVCVKARQRHYVIPPYIILLTVKDSKEDVVRGLGAGANDYVSKPFDQSELLARVRVGQQMVKLQQKLAEQVSELETMLSRVRHLQVLLRKDTHVYEFGRFRLDAAERRLTRDGQQLPLTAKVFDLLLLLVQNNGHLVTKREIMNEIWPDLEVEENNLTVSMSMLRKALSVDGKGDEYIETVPKSGYRFTAELKRIA